MLLQLSLIPVYLIIKVFLITTVHSCQNNEYYYIADDRSQMRRVYSSEPINEDFIKKVNEQDLSIYYLYTRNNRNNFQILKSNDTESVKQSNFNAQRVTVVLIHGWFGNGNSTMNTLLKDAFLQNDDVNVIVVDWCAVSCMPNYFTVVSSVPTVGSHIGKFLKRLNNLGMCFNKVHLVGHSLGAHVAGNVGKETKAKVQRITGLDPAGPFWHTSSDRLAKSNAQYVEVIHTNTKCLGYKQPCGDADFFPNGGSCMPGCKGSTCSHSRAYYYMAHTVKYNNMYALPCKDMNALKCNVCKGEPYLMGNSDLFKNRTGIFRVETSLAFDKSFEYRMASGFEETFENRRFFTADSDCQW